ncbi:MAG: hypothetical protein WCA98_14980 [Candidatus Acidiferrales bacterium]
MSASQTVAEQGSSQPISLGMALRKVFSFPVFLGVLLFAGVFASTFARGTFGANLVSEGDTWWHLATGERILATHHLPVTDPYSFTVNGQPWLVYEWLGEVTIGYFGRLGGLAGLSTLLLVVSGTLLLLLYYYAYLRSANWKASFVACTLVLPLTTFFFTLRPQLIGYVFLLITLICLERFRSGRQQTLWILPPLFLIWVNVHGSFALGFLVLGVYWVSGLREFQIGGLVAKAWSPRQRLHIAYIFLLSLLAALVTPYGSRIAAYPLQPILMQPVGVASILEWMPMPFNLMMGKMLLGGLLLFIVALAAARPVFRVEDFGLFLIAMAGAILHRRLMLFLLVIFIPIIATLIRGWFSRYRPEIDHYILNAALIFLIALAIVKFSPTSDKLASILPQKFPVGAVSYLRQHPLDAPMFNEYGWGGYLIWARPEGKVFIDGRADIYEYAGVLSDYLDISRLAPNTLFLLRKYNVGACLLEPSNPLGTLLRVLPDWEIVYQDKTSILFVRKNPRSNSGTS